MMGLCRVADTSILRGPCKDIKEGLNTATVRVRLSSCRFRISNSKNFFMPIPNRMLSYQLPFRAQRYIVWEQSGSTCGPTERNCRANFAIRSV